MDLDGNLSSIEDVEMMMQQPFFDTISWNSALTSILPKSLAENGLHFLAPVLRRFLFSVANNFAGLGAFRTGDIIPYLQKEGDAKHYQLIRSAPGYSSRMITQTLFKAAIEAGNAGFVDLLLRQLPATIDVNKQVLCVDGLHCTPIERATVLQHVHVVEILLEHGAHITVPAEEPYERRLRTFRGCGGTLDCAVTGMHMERYHWTGRSVRLDHRHRIFKRLLDAGGDLGLACLSRLIEWGEGELVAMVAFANAPKDTAKWCKWCKWGLLTNAVTFLDDENSIAIISTMVRNGADLNYDVKLKHHFRIDHYGIRYGKLYAKSYGEVFRAIDAAALSGKLEISKLLLDLGAQMTYNTLPFAVTSENEDLITMLLDRGANVNGIGSFKIPPLAAAIRTKNTRVISTLEARGASILMHDQEYCRAILQAATEVGNIPVAERLVRFASRLHSSDLGAALDTALENDQDEIVQILIELGDTVNCRPRSMESPLSKAIKKRKQNLVFSMLDAGIDPNCRVNPPLIGAVEWGHTSMIKALIFVGADVNESGVSVLHPRVALTVAVSQQDLTIVQLLLDAGADINNPKARKRGFTALSAAVEKGDFKMACYLLNYGADPHDSIAFEKAMSQERGLLDLLLQRHNSRYPKGRPGFGSSALVHAIKKGDESSVKMMLANGIDFHSMIRPNGMEIHSMIRPNGMEIHSRRKDLHNRDSFEATPLWYSIMGKRHSIIDMLLVAGCNPEEIVYQVTEREDGGSLPRTTAFVAAIETLDISIIKLFLRHKANVNFSARGRVTRTPLQKAAELGDLPVLELLLNHGADVNAPAAHNGGGTALQLAAIGGYFPVVCKLLAFKADANAPGAKVNGRFALEGAAEHGRLDMVQLLLNAGAGTGESGERQVRRAIELADENGHFPICDLLRDHFHLGE